MTKLKKTLTLITLALTAALLTTGCSVAESGTDMTDAILSHMEELAKIPRPSQHEEKIGEYLKGQAEEKGYEVTQDEYKNIIFDVPATKGYEDLPKIALQGHMDMVFAQADGLDLDPLTTEIRPINDGTYLKTDGSTSLGADDGIGVAMILCITEGKTDHGPLRVIITADEEKTTSGAQNIDPKFFSDVKYLINIDSEQEGELCVSSASCEDGEFTGEYKAAPQTKDKAYEVTIKGLTGGHSGTDINKNRLNGAIGMGYVLDAVKNEGIDFELKSLTGGFATNVIMYSASAVICIDEADTEKLMSAIEEIGDKLKKEYAETDPGMEITVAETETEIDGVLPQNGRDAAIYFLNNFKNGVRSMSPDIEGLVECSTNLGIIEVSPTSFDAKVMSRSCSAEREAEQMKEHEALADEIGFKYEYSTSLSSWEYKPDGKLEKLFNSTYKELYGKDMKVLAVHAGLECGEFAKYNDKLEMVSVGPTIEAAHSVDEKLEIASVGKVWDLLAKVLVGIE